MFKEFLRSTQLEIFQGPRSAFDQSLSNASEKSDSSALKGNR